MPANIQQTVRRRGAISAEPINEEDAATYVKKVSQLSHLRWANQRRGCRHLRQEGESTEPSPPSQSTKRMLPPTSRRWVNWAISAEPINGEDAATRQDGGSNLWAKSVKRRHFGWANQRRGTPMFAVTGKSSSKGQLYSDKPMNKIPVENCHQS